MDDIQYIQSLFLHNRTLWSKHVYGHTPIPQRTFFTEEDIRGHLQQEHTASIQLLHPSLNTVKACACDIDAHDGNIQHTLDQAHALHQICVAWNISSYLEFSGRRGYHVWIFVDGTIEANIARKVLLFLVEQAEIQAEIFPFGDSIITHTSPDGNVSWEGSAYKPIKLPFGKHQEGGVSGFLSWDTKDIAQADYIDRTVFLSSVKKNPRRSLEEIASLYVERSPGDKKTEKADFTTLGNDHPDCISSLLQYGAPSDITYNQANVILARYAISRDMSDEDAQAMGNMLAQSTERQSKPHPTTKTLRKKVADFAGVFRCAKKHKDTYQWSCYAVFASKDMVRQKWCSGWDCPIYPQKKADIESPTHTSADIYIERDIIHFLLQYQDKALEYARIEEVPSEGFIALLPLSDTVKKTVPIYRYLFDVCCQLIGKGVEIRESTLLQEFRTQSQFEKYMPHILPLVEQIYDILNNSPPCHFQTFQEEIRIVYERGLKILAKRDLVTATKVLSEGNGDGFSNMLAVVETLHTTVLQKASHLDDLPFVQYIPTFLQQLRFRDLDTIPTEFSMVNYKLTGGLRPRLYVMSGEPGSGKTTLALQCARYVASQKVPTLLLEYEMSKEEIFLKLLAMETGIDSMEIETLNWDTQRGSFLWQQIEEAAMTQYDTLQYLKVIECGKEDTVYTIRAKINRWKQRVRQSQGESGDNRCFVIVDSINHVTTGNPKIDGDETQCSSWVGTELARMTRPSDTNAAILGISEITKAALDDAIRNGNLHLGSLRGSFRVAHSAHAVFVLQKGVTDKGKNQVELFFGGNENKIREVYERYPIDNWTKQGYVALKLVKNRSGLLGTVLLFYEKGLHRFRQIDVHDDSYANDIQMTSQAFPVDGNTEEVF